MTAHRPPATRLTDRALIRVGGPDARAFLQGIVTQDVAGPLPAWAALLSPQGKVLFDFILWPDADDAILIDAEAAHVEELVRRLTLYRLRRAVTIEGVADRAVHWSMEQGPGRSRDPRLDALGWRWIGDPDTGPDTAAWRAHRLAQGVTEGRAELGYDARLWLECNAAELHGVSFSKGCYVGQENTARMNWRQKINRRMVVVPSADADPARAVIAYHDLGWSVEHRRVDAIDPDLAPAWLRPALLAGAGETA